MSPRIPDWVLQWIEQLDDPIINAEAPQVDTGDIDDQHNVSCESIQDDDRYRDCE